ncbi:hypothetical protein SAMN04489713_10155 [Actinomadura madurae]|uniref:Uncharacterized protein n=1 Tax=Actinomadura madurae TaxID=1993 RepID=A0A1I4VWT2_9ACTN|nr:hypothetical protein SAMN04489713_10155 [Actinomadura madurae]
MRACRSPAVSASQNVSAPSGTTSLANGTAGSAAPAPGGGPDVSCNVPDRRYWTRAFVTLTARQDRNVRKPVIAALTEPPSAYPRVTDRSVTGTVTRASMAPVPAFEATRLRARATQRFVLTESSFPREGTAICRRPAPGVGHAPRLPTTKVGRYAYKSHTKAVQNTVTITYPDGESDAMLSIGGFRSTNRGNLPRTPCMRGMGLLTKDRTIA